MSRPDRILLGLLAVVAVLAIALSGQDTDHEASMFGHSSYSASPSGCKALYTILQRLGFSVQRTTAPLETLSEGSAIILVNPQSPDWHALRTWVSRGHVAIVAEDHDIELTAPDKVDFVHVIPWGPGTGLDELPVYGGHRLETTDADLGTGAAIASDTEGAVAVWIPVGRGACLLLQSSWTLSNSGLGHGDAIALVQNAIRMSPQRGPVIFDEYDHGYRDKTGLWDIMPASVHWGVFQCGAILLLWAWASSIRTRPPLRLVSETRSRAEYLASLAGLMQRSRHPQLALDQAAQRLPDGERAAAWRQRAATAKDESTTLKLIQEARALEEEARRTF